MRWGIAVVRGRSMLPTLRDGDRVLVAYGARPRPGRLVVCRLPPDGEGRPRPLAIKRLTGPAAHHGLPGPGWWVERDNPAEGVDSWQVGALPPEAILAVVLVRLPRAHGLRRRAGRGLRWARERE